MSQSIPTVEQRLYTAQRALALGYFTLTAMTHGGDLGLMPEDQAQAYSTLAENLKSGLDACRAASAALPVDASKISAPEVE